MRVQPARSDLSSILPLEELALYRCDAFCELGVSLLLRLAGLEELLLSPALGVGFVVLDGPGAWSLPSKGKTAEGTWTRGELFWMWVSVVGGQRVK